MTIHYTASGFDPNSLLYGEMSTSFSPFSPYVDPPYGHDHALMSYGSVRADTTGTYVGTYSFRGYPCTEYSTHVGLFISDSSKSAWTEKVLTC